jgi:ABC-2 type transport system permease protein
MSKLFIIARHEFTRFARRKSFLLGTLALPLIIAVLVGVGALVSLTRHGEDVAIGYVDQAGLFSTGPEATERADGNENMVSFSDLDVALKALASESVAVVYLLPPSYRESGQASAYYMSRPPSPEVNSRFAVLLRGALVSDLPPDVQHRLLTGPEEVIALAPDGAASKGLEPSGLLVPIAIGIFFTLAVMGSAGYLLQAVTDEKESRTVEVVTTSVSPEQLVGGKALGLTGLALAQVMVWVAFGVIALFIGSRFLGPLSGVGASASFIAFAATFFLPSFVLAAGIMIGIGAAVPDFRQGQQVAGVMNFLFILPLFFLGLVFSAPDSPVLVALSLFPTTSFLTLAFRFGVTSVPFWQVAVAFVLLLVSASCAVLLAPRVFRLGMLRYGRRMDFRSFREAFKTSPTRKIET